MSYPYHVFDGWVVSMSLEIECIILVPQLSFLCKVLIRRYEKWGYLVVVWACFVALLAGGCSGQVVGGVTSRKLCPKKPTAKINCGSFNQLDMQSLSDYNFFFFILQVAKPKKKYATID